MSASWHVRQDGLADERNAGILTRSASAGLRLAAGRETRAPRHRPGLPGFNSLPDQRDIDQPLMRIGGVATHGGAS